MTDTLLDLVKRNGTTIEKDYQSLLSHFNVSFYDMSNCEAKKAEGVCVYYLSQIVYNKRNDYQHLFNYMTLIIKYIKEDSFLDKVEKGGRIVELSCVMPESFRTFYFCWLIQQDERQLLEYCYEYNFFVSDAPNDNLLSDIIRLVCTGNKPRKEAPVPINTDNIELEDYTNELFDETYNRLFNNKKVKS